MVELAFVARTGMLSAGRATFKLQMLCGRAAADA